VPVTTYSMAVSVLDAAAAACAGAPVARAGAAVRVTGSGVSHSGTTDAQGRASFTLPAGSYTVQAFHQGCRSAQATTSVSGNTQHTLTLADCGALTLADLAVTLGGASNPLGGHPYALPITVRNRGTARSLAGQVVLRRLDAAGGPPVQLLSGAVPALCPGQERAYGGQDPGPVAGQTYTYTAQTSVSDGNNGNNFASRTVAFAHEVVASVPVADDPPPVSLAAFAIRNGLPYVTLNRAVPLNATANGDPTEYRAAPRAAGCSGDLAAASWRAWSAASPPTWSSAQTGRKTVCFQLRRGSGATAVLSSIAEDAIGVVDAVWTSSLLGTTATVPPAPLPSPAFGVLSCGTRWAVGLDVRAGQYVDAVALRCADLGPAGEHSNAVTSAFVGGNGGDAVPLRCQTGEVLARVSVRYGVYVDQVTVACKKWRRDSGSSGAARLVGSAGGTGGLDGAVALCPEPLAVTRLLEVYTRGGILPGTGPYVTAFKTVCAVPPGL
ncbi:MAG TPA: carboxypeptidase-like regulatory domain-containing protein, partial [Gemmatimonadales bacterium]|nr:carboxypeptidase-like regulatory domain-containing protein [Gemmatimonadales bacterium]